MNWIRPVATLPLLLTAVLLGGPAEAQERIPIVVDDLFAIQEVGVPAVSPDGAWIAYTVTTTELEKGRSISRVWMVSAQGGEPLPMTMADTSSSSPAWSPDGRYLTFTAARGGKKTQVWGLDRRGGEAVPLTDVKQGVGGYRWSPDGTRLLLSIRDPEEEKEDKSEDAPEDPWVVDRLQFKRDYQGYLTGNRHTHLYVFDLASKALTQLTNGRWDESQARWSPDGTRIAFVSNRTEEPDGNENTDIWIVDAGLAEPTDAPARVTSNPGTDSSPAWSPDGNWIAHVTQVDMEATMWYATSHLAVVRADGQDLRLLTAELDRNVSTPTFSADGSWIWFGLEDSGEDHVARIKPDGSDLQRPVSGPLSASGFDWAAGTFAVRLSTPDRPEEIFLLQGGSGGSRNLERVTGHNDGLLARVQVGETRAIHFPSADGTEIEGFVTFPPDFQEGQRYPTLLRIHGGPVAQYNHAFEFEAQLLAAAGYLVVRVNPRGSSGYGQPFSLAIFADWGNKDFQDVMAGVDYAIAQGWADPDRLGVGGWSYGGILTNHVITKTDRYEGAISGASEVLYISNYGHDHYQLVWEQELGLPWEGNNRETWERLSPFNYVTKITTPTLLMGGEEDWNVPILNSEQLYQALRRIGIPTQLVVYPGEGHGISVPAYQKDRYERYLAWYDKWVKNAGAG